MSVLQGDRERAICNAALLLGAGVLITVVSLAAGGGTFILAWGPILFGAARLVRAMALPRHPPFGSEEYDQQVGRDGPEDPRPQVAGATCAHCATKVTSELDGVVCASCNKPLHTSCRKDHRRDEHTKARRAAYR